MRLSVFSSEAMKGRVDGHFLFGVALLTTLQLAVAKNPYSEPVVHTSLGTIRGLEQVCFPLLPQLQGQKVGNVVVSGFLGVPYGHARRFARPQKVEKWDGELAAKTLAVTCSYTLDAAFGHFRGADMWNAQNVSRLSVSFSRLQKQSEDCLAMNIWVPPHHNGSVIVWIFGGGFFSGSPSLELYDGATLAAEQGVIVANINYRQLKIRNEGRI